MAKTDARVVQTKDALRTAVLRLAAKMPIADIAVAELSREAGISRVTFYDHYSSPFDVLVEALTAELDEILRLDRLDRATGVDAGLTIESRSVARLAEHMTAYRDVYENSMLSGSRSTVHYVLTAYFTQAQLDYLTMSKNSVRLPEGVSIRAAANYVGHGMVGAMELWLEDAIASGDFQTGDLVAAITAMRPSWWR